MLLTATTPTATTTRAAAMDGRTDVSTVMMYARGRTYVAYMYSSFDFHKLEIDTTAPQV